MKIHPIAVLLSGVLAFQSPSTSEASNVGTGTIEQPVNLGPASDPARIPLGAVGTISNYNYGVHGVISAPRPCPAGAMRWEGGSELDQNLASVFGISVEPEDSTTVPTEALAADYAKETLRLINRGIHDGLYLAEKAMPPDTLPESGLRREIGKGGYYGGLASYCNAIGIDANATLDPPPFGNPDLDQPHQAGWNIGRSRGLTIASEAKATVDEAKRNEKPVPVPDQR